MKRLLVTIGIVFLTFGFLMAYIPVDKEITFSSYVPDMTFQEIFRIAFKNHYIGDRNHPILKQLRGEL